MRLIDRTESVSPADPLSERTWCLTSSPGVANDAGYGCVRWDPLTGTGLLTASLGNGWMPSGAEGSSPFGTTVGLVGQRGAVTLRRALSSMW